MFRDEYGQFGSDAERAAARARGQILSDEEGYQSLNQDQEINSDPGLYDSALDHQIPSNFEDSGYDSPNEYARRQDPEFAQHMADKRRQGLIDTAKINYMRGRANLQNRIPKDVAKTVRAGINDPAAREQAKELAKQKTRRAVKDKVAKNIGDQAFKKGFSQAASKSAGAAAKQGAKKAGKAAGKAASKTAAKAAAKVGAQAGTKALQAGVMAGGTALGSATFGLGFIAGLLLNIAISLGVNDAVDAGFELAQGNVKHATFLAIRAVYKVLMFIVLLITAVALVSVGGIIIGIPLLILIDLYWVIGIFWKSNPGFQGLVMWEKFIIVLMNVYAFIITLVFILSLGYFLCTTTGLGGGGVQGYVTEKIVGLYDWWSESNVGATTIEICKYINTPGTSGSAGQSSTTQ